MHVSTKDTDENGVHILTNTVEGDGPVEVASAKAKLSARVISVQRTDSGGVRVQTALEITEPQPEAPKAAEAPTPAPTPEEEAAAFLKEQGLSDEEAKTAVEKFGSQAILLKRMAKREAELNALLGGAPKSSASPSVQ
jgi:hypothetical protein